MSAIKNIKLYNFKAFYDETTIELNDKHLLIYGENGSGKSSIYWALYTLFQSETKSLEQIAKYFTPTHDEQLINYNYLNQRHDFAVSPEGKITNPTDIGKNAEIEVVLTDGTSLKIDKDGFHESIANKIRELHRHSDFITHRLLVNFYNFRNSKEINLWEVFVRDFFPFLRTNKGILDITLSQKLDEIETNLPFNLDEASGTIKRSRSKNWQNWLHKEIDNFNTDIEYWIGRINTIANDVYKNELKINDDIEIFLQYSEGLRYDHYKDNEYKKNGKTYKRWTTFAGLNEPKLILNIKRVNPDGTFSLIHRPQAYLNEAKITQIALSIRFSLLHETIKPNYPGQFLALDDLLISLDMSNRDIVLDAILNIYAKRFKLYMFTHERAFFNMVRSRLAIHNLMDNWTVKEIHLNTFAFPNTPIIVDEKDYLSEALKHLKNFDYPASANYLRKECEGRLKQILPENLSKKVTDEETKYKQLEDLISAFIKYYKEILNQDPNDFLKLKHYKDVIFNPLSHDNLDTNYYKDELLLAHNLLLKLRKIKRIKLINAESKLFFYQSDNTGIFSEFTIQLKENFNVFKLLDGSTTNSNINCTITNKLENGNNHPLNQSVKYNDIQKVIYKYSMKTKEIKEVLPDARKVLFNENNESIENLLESNQL